MNIFIINQDPRIAATNLCDQHVPRMATEGIGLMTFWLHEVAKCDLTATTWHDGEYLLKLAPKQHRLHPTCLWIFESSWNFEWLLNHVTKITELTQLRAGVTKLLKLPSQVAYIRENYNSSFFDHSEYTPYKLACGFASGENYDLLEQFDCYQVEKDPKPKSKKSLQYHFYASSFEESVNVYREYYNRKKFNYAQAKRNLPTWDKPGAARPDWYKCPYVEG